MYSTHLKRDPGFSKVHGLVHGHGVGPGAAELQGDVGEFELLAEREIEGDVPRGLDVGLRHPAGQVVGVVQVGQVSRGKALLRHRGVANAAIADHCKETRRYVQRSDGQD